MKNRLVNFSVALMLLAVLGKFYAKPLLAQVRAALVADLDTPGRVPYQRWLAIQDSVCVAGISGCSAGGAQVPTGKRLAITNVSGAFDLRTQAGQFLTVSLEHGSVQSFGLPPSLPPIYLPTFFQGTFSNADEFVVNAPILAYFDSGDYPIITVRLGANNTTGHALSFALSGYMLDCSVAPCAAVTF